MSRVSELIKNLLNESFVRRLDDIEKRFTREGTDITQLENNVDSLKRSLRECETRNEALMKALAESEMNAVESRSKMSRAVTETNVSKTTSSGFKRDKSVGRTLTKDKSVGKNLGKSEDKTLSKVKTVANLRKGEESKTSTSIIKKSGTVTKIEESSKNLSKTPKSDKTLTRGLNSPEKTKVKNMTRTPTQGNLKTDESANKTLKRTPTNGKTLKDDTKEKTLDKSHTVKGNLTKSNTKPNLNKSKLEKTEKTDRSDKTDKHDKTEKHDTKIASPSKKNESSPPHFQQINYKNKSHPSRLENISATIGVETHINDELLTKEDLLLLSGLQDKAETIAVNSSSNKLDFGEILDDRWSAFGKYWNRFDHIKFLCVNKALFGKLSITQLITEVQKEILENEAKIKALREKNSAEDLAKEQNPFNLTRGALKAIELLNDTLYIKLFAEGNIPADDIILTYRIFFQLLNKKDFVEIKNPNEFWKKTCEYFVNDSNPKLGTMIQNLVKEIDFSSENIHRLIRLVGSNVNKISPNYFSKLCGTTGLFIFLIKDAFDYAGILVDKKTSPGRLYKNYMYNFEVHQGKMERLKKIQSTFFN